MAGPSCTSHLNNIIPCVCTIQVNSISLLGKTHDEALKILHGVLDRMTLLVCHGYNPALTTPVNSECGSITSWGDGVPDEQTDELEKHIYDQPSS